MLSQSRYKWPTTVGLYTSPHLESVCERIRLNGKAIDQKDFAIHFFEVYKRIQASGIGMPGYFRFLTLLSFYIFVKRGVDAAIIETGVGGEYDSTNIIQCPAISVITTISYDHQLTLGNSLEQIAWHKGGIIKPGRLALVTRQTPEVHSILHQRAIEKRAKLVMVETDDRITSNRSSMCPEEIQNCSLALAASEAFLQSRLSLKCLPTNIIQAVAKAKWPGRFHVIETNRVSWCLDGGHNQQGIRAAASWFADLVSNDRYVGSKIECQNANEYSEGIV